MFVLVSASGKKLLKEVTFDLDVWHTMMMVHFHIISVKFEGQGSEFRVHGHGRKNVAKVVGSSLSEGFLVNADYLLTYLLSCVGMLL